MEYLGDEPSSSEKDVRGAGANRLVPAPHKITFPLMALSHKGRTLGVMWELSDKIAAVHDSPDRVFGGKEHLMALWGPGVGPLRRENQLFADGPFAIAPGETVEASIMLSGGTGGSIVPAIQEYVALHGLPPLPVWPGGFQAALNTLGAGYARSICHDGQGRWSHAVAWGGNESWNPAPDAVAFCQWLASRTTDTALAGELKEAAALGLQRLNETGSNYSGGIAHDAWPVTNLVLGKLAASLDGRAASGLNTLTNFDTAGILHFHPAAGQEDLDDTNDTDHANGLAATTLQAALLNALMTLDPALISSATRVLDQQTALYASTVPRGAQTWEIPLHTPDIMASAYLCKSYLYGYELTGRQDLLEQAKYWAWTGVPFVYLQHSFGGAVGEYATIPVLGATHYVAPNWIGLPVQWCGLVYRNALTRLAVADPSGPWKQLADGITLSGLQQSWPVGLNTQYQGTLPDSFNLVSQTRNAPHINPGTVMMGMPEAFGAGAVYDWHRAVGGLGWMIHAPGAITMVSDSARGVRFQVAGWGDTPYSLFLAGVAEKPAQVLTRKSSPDAGMFATPAYDYNTARKRLIISGLVGDMEIEVNRTASGIAAFDRYR